jgi:hypothetical protein
MIREQVPENCQVFMDHLGVVMQKHVLQVFWQELLNARERQRLIVEVECQEWSTARIQSYTAMQMKIIIMC